MTARWLVMVVLCTPCVAGEVTPEQLKARAAALRAKPPLTLPGRTLTVAVEFPFVIVGDDTKKRVEARAHGTVRRCVTRLRAMYFDKVPSKVITIWLMRDRKSYLAASKVLTGGPPGSPYGFYSRHFSLMLMNISTGGGTLVHEIVHPLIETNFPGCPSWFNEGLASLYEYPDYDGPTRIVGRSNWRLRGLHKALAKGDCPTIAEVCGKSRDAFYGKRSGTNYAVARYVLFYLQDQGLLRKYYRAFRAGHAKDRSGYATLLKVLEDDGVATKDFQKRWETYIKALPPYRSPKR